LPVKIVESEISIAIHLIRHQEKKNDKDRYIVTFHDAFNVNRQRFQDDVAFAIDLPGSIDIPNCFVLKIIN